MSNTVDIDGLMSTATESNTFWVLSNAQTTKTINDGICIKRGYTQSILQCAKRNEKYHEKTNGDYSNLVHNIFNALIFA